ncbi:hypothetical protein WJX81_007992 [Elliptochloris bilobata]|uniref:Uncharacterized protein n=1 Tax=Elliptochloris bilobata TaxID=381761 RepID=A0AAW1S371_9CHLO
MAGTYRTLRCALVVLPARATLDSRLGLRRRARTVAEDARRSWPKWRRQYKDFSGTPLGRAAFLTGIFLLFYTGIAFRLLNMLFLLWWIGPLIVLPLLQAASRKAVADAQKREAAAAAAARNPWSAFGRRAGGQAPGGGSGRPGGGPARQEGPVIDAEWTTIDDDS